MKVSKKTGLSLGMEAAIIRSGAYEVTASPASDWLRDISGSHIQPLISLNQLGQFFTNFHKPYLRSAEEDRLAGGLIWKVTRIGTFWT